MAGVKFCGECHDLLYPCEGKVENTLVYKCKNNCNYEEQVESMCVYRVDFDRFPVGTQSLEDDAMQPTLARTKAVRCPSCSHEEAFFFQASNRGEGRLTLKYICCNVRCNKIWTN